jgi:hypothetical protein
MGTSSRTVRCGRCAGPIFHSCPHGTGLVQWLGYSIGYSHGALALILDRLLFRPDISPVGADRASVMRCGRLLALADGRCCCCHRCCQPRSGDRVRGRDQTVRVVREAVVVHTDKSRVVQGPGRRVAPGRERHFLPVVQSLARRLCPTAPGICLVTARTFQRMAPYPGQARCLALGFWPECFRRLNVKSGRRPFPKETRSALDIEGKHVTIQGPSPGLSPAATLAPLPSALLGCRAFRSVDSSAGIQILSDQSVTSGLSLPLFISVWRTTRAFIRVALSVAPIDRASPRPGPHHDRCALARRRDCALACPGPSPEPDCCRT